MHIVLVGPGRIGAMLMPRLQQSGHNITVLSRREYGDFFNPVYDPGAACAAVSACDAIVLLAGLFELHANEERMGQANATGPIRVAENLHARFPKAQVIAFLDARIQRPADALPEAIRPYMASKRRLARWVHGAALAWGRCCGTRVNAIAPGPVLAPPNKAHSEKGGACLTPRPTIEDIGAALDFLLATPSVTGQILYVAAGQQLL